MSSETAVSNKALLVGCLVLLSVACNDTAAPNPGPAIRILTGGADDTIGTMVPISAEVRTALGLPARGVVVEFQEMRADGDSTRPPTLTLFQPLCCYDIVRDTTDGDGRASATVRLGGAAGAGVVMVRAVGFPPADTARFTTEPGRAVAIAVDPRDRPIAVGASFQLSANLIDRLGNAVTGAATLSTSSSAIQLSAQGLVEGNAIGRASIVVQIGGMQDSALVSVVPVGTLATRDYTGFVGDSTGYDQMDIDGSHFHLLANTDVLPSSYAPTNAGAPVWIPGTGQFVHLRIVDGTSRLFVGDSTGAARRLIASPGSITGEVEPDVSPDGAWVYFVGVSGGAERLWRVATSGGTPESLATSAVEMRSLSVSPDGKALVYAAAQAGDGSYHAYIHDLTTGADQLVSANEAAGTRWSPANDWIAYAISGPYAGYSGHLHLVHPDGTGDHELSDRAYYPGGTWSPDGKYFLVIRADGPYLPELIDVASGVRLPLVSQRIWYGPAWRH